MGKIPVFKTVGRAYGFAFGRYVQLLGIAWAPLAVIIAVNLMLTPGFLGHQASLDAAAAARDTAKFLPVSILLLFPARAMIATAMTELALGMRTGTTFVHFSLGASVWRLIGAWLLSILVIIVLAVGGLFAFGISVALGKGVFAALPNGMGVAVSALVAVLLLVVLYAAMIFIAVRITFFIPAVVVREKKMDLARAWQLSHGNFWRIVVVGFALLLPVAAIGIGSAFAIYGNQLVQDASALMALVTSHVASDVIDAHIQMMSADMRQRALAVWPYTSVFQILFGTLIYGLTNSASAFAYEAVTKDDTVTLP